MHNFLKIVEWFDGTWKVQGARIGDVSSLPLPDSFNWDLANRSANWQTLFTGRTYYAAKKRATELASALPFVHLVDLDAIIF